MWNRSLSNTGVRGFVVRQGADVDLYKPGSKESYQTVRALKDRREGKVLFKFMAPMNVEIGDRLQQSGSRDIWVVIDFEDITLKGLFSHFEAFVEKEQVWLERERQQHFATPSGNTFNLNGPNSRVNISSTDVSTNVYNNLGEVSELLQELLQHVERAQLTEQQKSESKDILTTLTEQFTKANVSPGVVRALLGALTKILGDSPTAVAMIEQIRSTVG